MLPTGTNDYLDGMTVAGRSRESDSAVRLYYAEMVSELCPLKWGFHRGMGLEATSDPEPRSERETKPKRLRGRPPVHTLPKPIDASPEEIANLVLKMPPNSYWRSGKAWDSAKSR
ncbi:MAG: hypothetical protein OXG11_06790 [Chloroflexi bacterium]|nr:hypothetical protein [Chloroflexota bacterium]